MSSTSSRYRRDLRIEQLTKTCDAPLLVSEETRSRVGAGFVFTAVEPIAVRGKSAPIHTYRVQRHGA